MTEYRIIPGFPHYKVSDRGDILNLRTQNHQRQQAQQQGILTVGVTEDFGKTILVVRRVVAEAFLPDFDPRYAVTHKDGDLKNCAADNLEMDFSTYVRGKGRVRTL